MYNNGDKENIGYARACSQTFENKGNTHNIISMDNILIWPVCGSGKKYNHHGK